MTVKAVYVMPSAPLCPTCRRSMVWMWFEFGAGGNAEERKGVWFCPVGRGAHRKASE